jgi:hypothetical protein
MPDSGRKQVTPSQPHDPDDILIEDLRALFAADDPVPPLVLEAGRASLGWRRLDADLAELLSDSALEEAGLALARGTAAIRSVSFGARGLTIDVELHRDGDGRRLLGQLAPPAGATVELQFPGEEGEPVQVTVDALGRFRAALTPASAFRLRVGLPDAGAPGGVSYTETSWVPL